MSAIRSESSRAERTILRLQSTPSFVRLMRNETRPSILGAPVRYRNTSLTPEPIMIPEPRPAARVAATRRAVRTAASAALVLAACSDSSQRVVGPKLPVQAALGVSDAEIVMSGLDNPRGLAFGPDGSLYVAEAGRGGAGPCFVGPQGGINCY